MFSEMLFQSIRCRFWWTEQWAFWSIFSIKYLQFAFPRFIHVSQWLQGLIWKP